MRVRSSRSRQWLGVLVVGFVALVIHGCNASPQTPASSTVTQISVSSPVISASLVASVQPTQTATTASTSTPQASASPTQSVTPTPSPTWPPLVKINNRSVSPDGRWTFTAEYELGNEVFRVRVFEEGNGWVFTATPETTWEIWGIFSIYRWSIDGRHVYFQAIPFQQVGHWYGEAYSLLRMDLETGHVDVVFKVNKRQDGFVVPTSLSLSPDEKEIAYRQTGALVIRNLATGEEQQIAVSGPYGVGGSYLWSPDGNQIVLALAQCRADYGDCFKTAPYTSIALIDVASEDVTVLYGPDSRTLDPIGWTETGDVLIRDRFRRESLILDLNTTELIPVESTPR